MICVNCNSEIEDLDLFECPSCEAVLRTAPARAERNRPKISESITVESENFNGRYEVKKLSDGSWGCDCHSFLLQNGTQNGSVPFMTCKHIRRVINGVEGNLVTRKPSAYQSLLLKKLGSKAPEGLTEAQAYYIINDLLQKQGVEYREFKGLIVEHSKLELLPITHFGIEFEGGIGCSKYDFQDNLFAAGIKSLVTGYDHTLHNEMWKIASDSSVSVSNLTSIELVSPKLNGAGGFNEVKKVLKLWEETLPLRSGSDERVDGVNASCGCHVHIDIHELSGDRDFLLELAKAWAKIEVPVIWYLVSPSRRGGRYCKTLDLYYLEGLIDGGMNTDRYYSLNYRAIERGQHTAEFRIHGGTRDAKKIIPWVVFLLKFVDSVKKGLRYSHIEPTFDGVMDAVGMKNSTPLIQEARAYLKERFEYWKEEAVSSGRTFPEPLNVDHLERDLAERRRRVATDRLFYGYNNRRYRMTTRNDSLPSNSIHNLASIQPSSVIGRERFSRNEDGSYSVPSREGERAYRVVAADDTLTCNCRGFRSHGYCYHSINLARFLVFEREIVRLEEEA